MKQKPGVMIYFSQVPFLQRMSAEQRGDLFLYIIEYAQHGVVPEIEDPLLGMAWDVMRPAIDLDTERYEARCERNRQNGQNDGRKDRGKLEKLRKPKVQAAESADHGADQRKRAQHATQRIPVPSDARRRQDRKGGKRGDDRRP